MPLSTTKAVAVVVMWIGIDDFLSGGKNKYRTCEKKGRRCDIYFSKVRYLYALPIYLSDAMCGKVFIGAAEMLVSEETIVCR